MIATQRDRVLSEWRANRRLRLAVLVIVLVAGVHLALSASDRRALKIEEYRRDAELVERLRDASAESAWPARAEEAAQRLAEVHESLPQVASTGLAQAEIQAWLAQQAQAAGLGEPRVRVETTLDVPGHPELWQVLARLDATVSPGGLGSFLHAVAGGLPWIQVERLDISTTAEGQRLVLTARGYYRKPASDADAAGDTDAAVADASGQLEDGA
ncbi:hypothetical protein E4582_11240 [Luteimonas yindakuii]|uniref:Uncharacterized protein n=1 Tax=Luteimonas yindakuii TaxID=2565782 RepID=A0A4Z1RDP5_9GAMM|nr:hypothetical protein [Luteimonas yindakuii]TKS52807.1 hypothetical protein E4582_11240 [Luteimonas yindakuii]